MSSLHVGLNLVFLVPGETGGMETYARALIPELVAAAPGARFTAFVNRETVGTPGPWGELVPEVTVPVRATRRHEWVMGEQVHLPRLAAREGVDLVHSLASTAPARGPFRRIVTVHDLNYAVVPDAHFGLRALGMRVVVPAGVRGSHRVIADSRATRDDLVRLLGVPPPRIDVVPLAAGGPPATPLDEAECRRRFGLGGRQVVLSVSAKRPHKNLARLIEAVAALPPGARPLLVLPGYPTPHEAELRALAGRLGVSGDVRLLGWLEPAELEGLWALSAASVFPSLYEGFGLPVLEGMRRGVPVACSDRSSLPEVAGDAALMFDPEDPGAIAGAIARLLGDPALRADLAGRGRRRAASFTWARTARETLASYARAMGRAPAAPPAA